MYLTLFKQSQLNVPILNYAELMNNNVPRTSVEYYKTTIFIQQPVPRTNINPKHEEKILQAEQYIANAWEILKPFEHTYEQQYYEFKIPKHSGGLRTINAPNTEFKEALSQVKTIFEQNLKCLAHNAAFAYTKQRSTIDAIQQHKNNQSNWFLKIDLTDFFPSCTPELIFTQLKKLYPFYYFSEHYDTLLKKIIKTCCLNNGLPQGTPMSPLLTNLIMIPFDYTLHNFCKRGTGEHYVYTRYADDILISSKSNFDWKTIEHYVENILVPFKINRAKTRYGSKAGQNWNLGLMLNKDNKITLGSVKKKTLNAMLNNFIRDFKNKQPWSVEDTQHLQGQMSYLQHIEPEYYDYIINKYQKKYNISSYRLIIKQILK